MEETMSPSNTLAAPLSSPHSRTAGNSPHSRKRKPSYQAQDPYSKATIGQAVVSDSWEPYHSCCLPRREVIRHTGLLPDLL
jgi:hypothetical protein